MPDPAKKTVSIEVTAVVAGVTRSATFRGVRSKLLLWLLDSEFLEMKHLRGNVRADFDTDAENVSPRLEAVAK